MTKDIEVVRGTGNVFRDFGRSNADLEQPRRCAGRTDHPRPGRAGTLGEEG